MLLLKAMLLFAVPLKIVLKWKPRIAYYWC